MTADDQLPVVYEVTEFEPPRRIAFQHLTGGMEFALRFEISPIADEACEISVELRAGPRRFARILEPVMRREVPRQADRITTNMVQVVESTSRPA